MRPVRSGACGCFGARILSTPLSEAQKEAGSAERGETPAGPGGIKGAQERNPLENDLRFAILIDADNISDRYIKIILDEASNAGLATYKRIYGDWTSPRLASWKNVLLENSIIPMQQYSYTYGKNSTDSAMIIDAMDILYSGTVDGFCIVSSDSDFTRLAARLRESGMQVIGMGEEKTPEPFISACNQFKYLDLLYAQQQAEEREERRREEAERAAAARERGSQVGRGAQVPAAESPKSDRRRDLKRVRRAIDAILDQFSDEDGWVSSGVLGDQLGRRLPDFDVRNFGFKKLTSFVKSLGSYEYDAQDKQIYFRAREE